MSAIAEAADVAIQTVYNVVGSKSDVLNLVLEETVTGPEAPRPVVQFMMERTERAEDAAAVVDLLADWFLEVHERSGAVFRMIREAAAVDGAVAAYEEDREQRRLANYRLAAEMMAAKPGARLRLDLDAAAAAIWSIGHPQVYRRLVHDGEWSRQRYRTWVAEALNGVLLEN